MTLYETVLKLRPSKDRAGELISGLKKDVFLCLVRGGFSNCEVVYNNWGRPKTIYSSDYEIWKDAKIDRDKVFAAVDDGSIWEVDGLGLTRIKEICDWLEATEDES